MRNHRQLSHHYINPRASHTRLSRLRSQARSTYQLDEKERRKREGRLAHYAFATSISSSIAGRRSSSASSESWKLRGPKKRDAQTINMGHESVGHWGNLVRRGAVSGSDCVMSLFFLPTQGFPLRNTISPVASTSFSRRLFFQISLELSSSKTEQIVRTVILSTGS